MNFRRWITALAVLALFVGLASAQVTGSGAANGSPLTCNATVAVPPQLRAEGMTDLIGDIVITCAGGSLLANGTTIPTANITVSLGTNVTSRLTGSSGSASEALLLIDEPGAPLIPPIIGYGPGATQKLCSSSSIGAGSGGCTQVANQLNGTNVATSSDTTAAVNMFQGLVSGNQVTFQGVPIMPPASTGVTRVFRITNVRANISGLGGGGLAGTTSLLASIAISGNTSLPINNPTVIAGFVQTGLTTSLRTFANDGGLDSGGATFSQCQSADHVGVAVLRYSENFGTAFKTRVGPATATAYSGQSNGQGLAAGLNQNIPGTIYNSESGFITPLISNAGFLGGNAGLADYGTRLKAVFNNVPNGVHIFVSVTNITDFGTYATKGTGNNAPAGNSTSIFAQMVVNEVAPDGVGSIPAVTPSGTLNSGTTQFAEVQISGGTGTAVWEIINTNPSQNERAEFAVWTSYTPNTASNLPTPGTSTVNMSYAPTPTTFFSASDGAKASNSLTIPRFADTSTGRNLMVINICQTLLLFPYVTNQAGFDTGLAIANTTQDPVGTSAQSGTCTLNWYDGTGKTPPTTPFNVAAGTVYTNLASVLAPGFQGYMFATCNFQFAHGFAFISDLGARNLAMGYLALIVNKGTVSRGPAAESLGN